MEKFVLDTNFFFNLEIKTGLGKNPREIIEALTSFAGELKSKKKAEFYMPPRILEEFYSFVDEEEVYVKDFVATLSICSADVSKINFPATVFYKLVDEIRERSYKGLRIAEEQTDKAGQTMLAKADLSKVEYQKEIGEIVTKLRDRYRQATRYNFLDSIADLDLITLAKEIDGFLVSSDGGVLRWGRIFGVKEIPAKTFRSRLQSL